MVNLAIRKDEALFVGMEFNFVRILGQTMEQNFGYRMGQTRLRNLHSYVARSEQKLERI